MRNFPVFSITAHIKLCPIVCSQTCAADKSDAKGLPPTHSVSNQWYIIWTLCTCLPCRVYIMGYPYYALNTFNNYKEHIGAQKVN